MNGQVATIVDVSETYDLALLKIDVPEDTPFAAFSELPARLNSDISVSGFPYAGLLGGLNITRGTVSSLSGLGGDVAKMQITAPIQRGNSGGPVFATNGGVIGVVVEKIDALLVAEFLDDLPQNVNFAIRSEIAKLFLLQNHVEPNIADRAEDMKPEDLAELAVKVTKFVECSGD